MQAIIDLYANWIKDKRFPCVAAKAAVAREQIQYLVADNMACPKDDVAILDFLYNFIDLYRAAKIFYHSAVVIFKGPVNNSEEGFDSLLWQRLQALSDMDAINFGYDKRVSSSPSSPNFSLSFKEEAMYVIGLHPLSNRLARQFTYPVLVFNPHAQFEALRKTLKYEAMKKLVRKRDVAYSGSVNPMLEDFGKHSEAFQYSGRNYDGDWQCPLKINHTIDEHHSAT
ncbi:MAG: guanitoxin biosynthesis heme-dependent pre-guanitoxin N-hydroxylase GntA [Ferruginibacter sp.]